LLSVPVLGFSSKDTPYHVLSEKGASQDADRISLWPLYYHDSTSTSVVWPFFSSGDDYLGICPFFSKRGRHTVDSFSLLWPFCSIDLQAGEGWAFPCCWTSDSFTLFPLFWHSDAADVLFPLFGHHAKGGRDTYWGACGLTGFKSVGGSLSDAWLFPAFYASSDTFLSLPFHHFTSHGLSYEGSLAGLVGWTRRGSELESSWAFPLYYANDDLFLSLPCVVGSKGWIAGLGLAGAINGTSWCLPLYLKTDKSFHTPLLSWALDDSDQFFSLPFISWWSDKDAVVLAGLGGWTASGNWLLPLYLKTVNWLHTPLFSWALDDSNRFFSLPGLSLWSDNEAFLLAGLGGWTADYNWLLPLYLKTEKWLHTPVFSWALDDSDHFFSLPVLSSWSDNEAFLLAGLGGWTTDSNWLLPLYLKTATWMHTPVFSWALDDSNRFFSLPLLSWADPHEATFLLGLAGWRSTSSWLLPAYVQTKRSFLSLPYCRMQSADEKKTSHVLPWALSGWTVNGTGEVTDCRLLLFLAGRDTEPGGDYSEWAIPFYSRKPNEFLSLVYGSYVRNGTTNTWWGLPLFGTRSGNVNGFWCVPFASYEEGFDFDEMRKRLDSPTLPDGLSWYQCVYTNEVGATEKVSRPRTGNWSTSGLTTLLWSWDERVVDSAIGPHGERLGMYDEFNLSSLLYLWNSTERRDVVFDVETRQKVRERHRSESSLLWRLWHRTEEDGNVSVDVFPGFSYDRRTNGYEKTSFLWRVFRYENDPARGVNLDVLFIPFRRCE